MKKIFLTSAVCMLCALPSYADIANGASSATCDSTTIGATEGSTGLEAQWTALTYSENPGYYLLFANDTISQHQTCPAGYFCEGFTDQTFADASMGLQSCADYDDSWPYSAAGATSASQCYNTVNITCSQFNPYTAGHGTATYANASTTAKNYEESGTILDTLGACAFTLTCDAGYTATSAGALSNYVPQNTYWDDDHIRFKALDNGINNMGNQTGLSAGDWEVKWGDGTTVKGHAMCSSTSRNWGETGTPDTTGAGDTKYCWCQMDNYKLLSNGSTTNVASPSWVFNGDHGSASNCADNCANNCAPHVQDNSGFRSALFGSLGANPECSANTISIDWDPKNGDAHTQNQCTYGGAVTIPAQPSKAGYTFGGWKVKTSNSGN